MHTVNYHNAMDNPRTIALHIRVSPKVFAAVKAIAEAEHRKTATMLALLIDEALKARQSAAADAP